MSRCDRSMRHGDLRLAYRRRSRRRRSITSHLESDLGHCPVFPAPLASVGFLPDVLPAPLRGARSVLDDTRLAALLPPADVRVPGRELLASRARTRSCIACITRTATRSEIRTRRSIHTNVLVMMWETKTRYDDFAYERVAPDPRFGTRRPPGPSSIGSGRAGSCASPGCSATRCST